jgi:hypothetical protein
MAQLKVKLIYATNYMNCERDLNHELSLLKDHKIRDVRVDTDWANKEDHYIGMILYEAKNE